jgi:hypothetical protein
MAKSWHNKDRTPQKGELVKAVKDFTGRITPPPPVWIMLASPSPCIAEGTTGIVNGRAAGAPELLDVSFEYADKHMIRVEVDPEYIKLI